MKRSWAGGVKQVGKKQEERQNCGVFSYGTRMYVYVYVYKYMVE